MSQAAKAYLSTQVTTTSQGDLLIMLYDAAIKFLKQSKVKIKEKNYAQKGILISRAIDIIGELTESLNKEKGGTLAENLVSLYLFCNVQLVKANLRMDLKIIDDIIGILTSLRDAYAQIVPTQEAKDALATQTLPGKGIMENSRPELNNSANAEPAPRPPVRPANPVPPMAQQQQPPKPAQPKAGPGQNIAQKRAASAYSKTL